MDQDRQQLVKKLQESANVLITVSNNPSVDQLASAIGLTLVLNKMGKHATAVFSGKVPNTIEFLKPEETLEKTTDSLRDFIISLDKSKADKLRYKVEDKLVRIFITPYRTSITDKDLEFSQGDFNVDVVMALGVHEQKDLDEAISSHGRILHDASVVSVNRDTAGSLSGINLQDSNASSLSEILAGLSDELKSDALDAQIATAFLTGIVAETHRFSNEKTTSATMSLSARLMNAGANQQLVATKLEEVLPPEKPAEDTQKGKKAEEEQPPESEKKPDNPPPDEKENRDGALTIDHPKKKATTEVPDDSEEPQEKFQQVHIDEKGTLTPAEERPIPQPPAKDKTDEELRLVLEPPTLGETMSASPSADGLDPATDPLSLPRVDQPLLSHDSGPAVPPAEPFTPLVSAGAPTLADEPSDNPYPPLNLPSSSADPSAAPEKSLSDIEKSVDSPHLQQSTPPALPALPDASAMTDVPVAGSANLDKARDAVLDAINASVDTGPPSPIEALNANPIDLNSGDSEPQLTPYSEPNRAPNPVDALHIESSGINGTEFKMPENLVDANTSLPPDATGSTVSDPTAPPTVPPPLMPPLYPTPNSLNAGPAPFPSSPSSQADGQAPKDDPAPPPSPFNLP